MSMNIVSLVRASLLGLALMLANTSPAFGQAQPAGGQGQRTLYERLGGYNGISPVVEDFENRLFVDPKLASTLSVWARTHANCSYKRPRTWCAMLPEAHAK